MATLRIAPMMMVLGSFAAAPSCNRESEREPAMQPAAAVQSAAESREGAIFELTEARCNYEWRCDNIGLDRQYPIQQQCNYEMNREGYEQLDPSCVRVQRAKLNQCLDAIKNQACGTPFDDLDDVSGCDPNVLCS